MANMNTFNFSASALLEKIYLLCNNHHSILHTTHTIPPATLTKLRLTMSALWDNHFKLTELKKTYKNRNYIKNLSSVHIPHLFYTASCTLIVSVSVLLKWTNDKYRLFLLLAVEQANIVSVNTADIHIHTNNLSALNIPFKVRYKVLPQECLTVLCRSFVPYFTLHILITLKKCALLWTVKWTLVAQT